MQHDHAALAAAVTAVSADLRETAGAWRIEGVDAGTAAAVLEDAATALDAASTIPDDASPAYGLLVAMLSRPFGPETLDAMTGMFGRIHADPHARSLAIAALRACGVEVPAAKVAAFLAALDRAS